MKISNSKKQLARIISENGGWRDGEFAAQDKTSMRIDFYTQKPWINGGQSNWNGDYIVKHKMYAAEVIPNWHQTILSRDEYFHLYPEHCGASRWNQAYLSSEPDFKTSDKNAAPDTDGRIEFDGTERPSGYSNTMIDVKLQDGRELTDSSGRVEWDTDGPSRIVAYHLHKTAIAHAAQESKPVPVPEATIEQLAADYRNAKDYAERKQQEADEAKADADARLKALELAGEALELLVSPITAKKESELVITDWRDLQVGDIIQCVGSWEKEKTDGMQLPVTALEGSHYNGHLPIQVEVPGISCPGTWGIKFKFIRRP